MTTAERVNIGEELAYENARNQTYIQRMRRRPITGLVGAPANTLWTGSVRAVGFRPNSLALFGRVGLGQVEADMGDNFYIGSGHFEEGDLRVFSWVSAVARTFFEGVDEWLDVPVVIRRTFRLGSQDRIEALYDDWVGGPRSRSPFDQRARLTVPTPPTTSSSVPPARRPATSAPESAAQSAQAAITPPAAAARPAQPAANPEPAAVGLKRAANAVRAALAAPRAERMSSVLSTLQPEQYVLVAQEPDRPLIVQGHPGTGKTIVAIHRAAYLANPDRGEGAEPLRVLVMGPTKDWVTHVKTAIDDLIPAGSVTVTNLQRCMFELAGLPEMPKGSLDGVATDVDWAVGDLIDDVAPRLRQACRDLDEQNVGAGVSLLWAALRAPAGLVAIRPPAGPLAAWLSRLPSYEDAARRARYLPVLAYCSLALFGAGGLDRFDHLVVDEAQDVRPLEWRILSRLNGGGGWTLVGDTNQRRADFCDSDWRKVAIRLRLTEGGQPIEPVVMELGYRSTREIMTFANRLLPITQRQVTSLQTGPKPLVFRATASQLLACVEHQALALARRHHRGLTAVITLEPAAILTHLRRNGWRVGDNPNNLSLHGHTLHIRRPDHARGVEYDGVVVVEPDAFPRNAGARAGELYTSLTRANRELVVVHARRLPTELVGGSVRWHPSASNVLPAADRREDAYSEVERY